MLFEEGTHIGREERKTGLLHIILWEEGTRIAREDGERRGIIYILYCWRKGLDIEPSECENGAMIYIY